MNKIWRIAFACGLGGLVGAFLALNIAARLALGNYFFVFGLLVGGVVGWLTYDVREVASQIAREFRQDCRKLREWKPDWEMHKLFLKAASACSITVLSYGVPLLWVGWKLTIMDSHEDNGMMGELFYLWAAFLQLAFGLWVPALAVYKCEKQKGERRKTYLNRIDKQVGQFWVFTREWNLFSTTLWLCVRIALGLWWVVSTGFPMSVNFLWGYIKLMAVVCWKTFRFVHSDLRALCFTDGTIGAAIGFFYGSPYVGLIAGLTFGVLNYLVVSRGILKLHKVRTKN